MADRLASRTRSTPTPTAAACFAALAVVGVVAVLVLIVTGYDPTVVLGVAVDAVVAGLLCVACAVLRR